MLLNDILLFGIFLAVLLNGVCAKLIGVIEVNRHGARAPVNYEVLASSLFYGSSKNQLTVNGYQQQELLGQWIGERYMTEEYKLLSEEYKPEEVVFKSSPEQRAIFSAVGFIKDLYPRSRVNLCSRIM